MGLDGSRQGRPGKVQGTHRKWWTTVQWYYLLPTIPLTHCHLNACLSLQTLQQRESAVNSRCENYDPNPSLDPERNFIKEYGLLPKLEVRRKQLKEQQNVTWHQIEQQLFEVQEYRLVSCLDLPSAAFAHPSLRMSLCLCLCLSDSCLCLSINVCLCLSMSLSIYISLLLTVCICLFLSLSPACLSSFMVLLVYSVAVAMCPRRSLLLCTTLSAASIHFFASFCMNLCLYL